MTIETKDRVDELLSDDADQLKREHPDLEEQLREYQEDWMVFREVLGRTEGDKRRMTSRRSPRRRAYRTP